MFTAFFLAFGVGALIAILWLLPGLAFGIGQALWRILVDVPAALFKGVREGINRGNRIADRLEGKGAGGTGSGGTVTETKPGD